MKDSTRILAFLAWTLICALIGFGLGRRTARNGAEPTIVEKADTTSTIEAKDVEKPNLKDSTVIHHVWVKVPVVPASQDSVPASQISPQDSALVEIPIERKIYQEDSLYRAVVSGYRVNLDSLLIFNTTTTVTVTKIERVEPKRWSFGITAGPSVLVTPSGKVYGGLGASVGLSYRF